MTYRFDSWKEAINAAELNGALTVADVVDLVDRLDARWKSNNDEEECHAYEDRLRHLVLRAIATGNPHAADLAAVALTTGSIKFARWCA